MPSVSVNGLDYAYEESGSGTPVVFAHGLTFDRHMWDPQVAALSSRYRCIAYDLLGHGASAGGRDGYSLEDEAENLHELMARWGATPAHIVALSMGGMMAMRFAIAHPQEVLSLALFDTSAEEEEAANVPRYEALLAASRGPNLAVAAYKESYIALDFDAIEPALKAVTGRTNVLPALSRLDVPALVVVGAEDVATTPDKAQHIAEAIPGARLETIAGAGHMSVVEQPERATELLSSFLDGIADGGPK